MAAAADAQCPLPASGGSTNTCYAPGQQQGPAAGQGGERQRLWCQSRVCSLDTSLIR